MTDGDIIFSIGILLLIAGSSCIFSYVFRYTTLVVFVPIGMLCIALSAPTTLFACEIQSEEYEAGLEFEGWYDGDDNPIEHSSTKGGEHR
jgi:hypothetical protein